MRRSNIKNSSTTPFQVLIERLRSEVRELRLERDSLNRPMDSSRAASSSSTRINQGSAAPKRVNSEPRHIHLTISTSLRESLNAYCMDILSEVQLQIVRIQLSKVKNLKGWTDEQACSYLQTILASLTPEKSLSGALIVFERESRINSNFDPDLDTRRGPEDDFSPSYPEDYLYTEEGLNHLTLLWNKRSEADSTSSSRVSSFQGFVESLYACFDSSDDADTPDLRVLDMGLLKEVYRSYEDSILFYSMYLQLDARIHHLTCRQLTQLGFAIIDILDSESLTDPSKEEGGNESLSLASLLC